MRVLYFTKDYTVHDRRFLAKIAERHEVLFLRLQDDGMEQDARPVPPGVERLRWTGAAEKADSPEAWLKLMPAFQKLVKQANPDLIHAGPIQSCSFLTALSGFHPFVAMSWGSDILVDSRRDEWWNWVTGYTLGQCDLFACDCTTVANEGHRLSGRPGLPTVQFPWGIDLSQFGPGQIAAPVRDIPGWKDNVFVVISNRSWVSGYGIETVLEAFALAHRSDPRLRMILAGAGPLAPAVHQFIEEEGLSASVYLPGVISNENMPGYLQAADLYLSCSPSDGTSISLLEAMASGLPVAITNNASNREWVSEPDNGWLCDDGMAASFAQAMAAAAGMRAECRVRMGANNRSATLARADWNVNSLKLFDAYDSLMVQA